MKIYEAHPIARKFPLMQGAEFEELKTSIAANGQIDPGIIFEGKLLDGRNRQEACKQLGIPFKTEPAPKYLDQIGAVAYVKAKNLDRRMLDESQKGMIIAALMPAFREQARERQKEAAKAAARKDKRDAKAKAEKDHKPAKVAKPKRAVDEAIAAAGIGKVSARTVQRAQFVKEKSPELAKKVLEGELTVKQAEKQLRHEGQVEQVKKYKPPEGTFSVIEIDPPWRYQDGLDGSDSVRGGTPYPTMAIDEVCLFVEKTISKLAAPTCDLFMWVTNSILVDPAGYAPVAQALIDNGFEPKQIRTWVKPRIGVGHVWRNSTEHLVRFEKGKPVHNAVTQATHFEAPVGEHSAKPDQAYDDIAALCPSPSRVSLFARADRKGWVTSGSELPATAAGGDAAPAVGRPGEPSIEKPDAAMPGASFSHSPGAATSKPKPKTPKMRICAHGGERGTCALCGEVDAQKAREAAAADFDTAPLAELSALSALLNPDPVKMVTEAEPPTLAELAGTAGSAPRGADLDEPRSRIVPHDDAPVPEKPKPTPESLNPIPTDDLPF
jgi:N6-adenosine-specific RNA methylase IME4